MENDFLVSEGHRYRCDALATDSTFFQLFSYPLIQGEKNLTDPSSVVLTQSYAREVFGSDNPVGKTITYSNGQEYVVKGVIGFPVKQNLAEFRYASGKYFFQYVEEDAAGFVPFCARSGYE